MTINEQGRATRAFLQRSRYLPYETSFEERLALYLEICWQIETGEIWL